MPEPLQEPVMPFKTPLFYVFVHFIHSRLILLSDGFLNPFFFRIVRRRKGLRRKKFFDDVSLSLTGILSHKKEGITMNVSFEEIEGKDSQDIYIILDGWLKEAKNAYETITIIKNNIDRPETNELLNLLIAIARTKRERISREKVF